ncbi:ISXoo6 transposase [Pseudomonas caricapapayae]|nr:ISXoo6 transposase [Pseudomonas caricapapayae]RMV92142.1 ISXoo6 transposase [Pseudomonas caricapapayae]
MKAHIGAESGLVHHVHGAAANVADVTQVAELCCMAKKTRFMQTLDTPVSRSVKSMKVVRSSGKSRRGAARIPGSIKQRSLQGEAQDRVLQSSDTGQGRTSVSGDQASVWLRKSALSWADEKHSSADYAVRPVESVEGSKTANGYGRVTRLTRETGQKCPQRRLHQAIFSE